MPPVERVSPNVWSIPVPFPNNPMRYTLSYLSIGIGEAVLVDPGWNSDLGWQHLVEGLSQAGISPTDLTGIVATHFHSDHLGMAGRLRTASGAWLGIGENELSRPSRSASQREAIAADRARFKSWGVPCNKLDGVSLSEGGFAHARNLAEPDLRLIEGQMLPIKGLQLRIMATPGHSPGHICLIDAAGGLIFSGDHVLPRISPHISFEIPGPENPLADYYESLERIGFEDAMEVCPAHEYRFIGMRRRVNQLLEHNRSRSREVQAILRESQPRTIWDIAQRLSWSRGWDSLKGFSLRLAVAETASHLAYLTSVGLDICVPLTEISVPSHL